MSAVKALAVAAVALAAGAFVEAARADEAYVCEGGKLVYVAFKDLERMKRENPCIAAHYGLAVERSNSTDRRLDPAAPEGTATAPAGPNGELHSCSGAQCADDTARIEKAASTGRITPGLATRRKAAGTSQAAGAGTQAAAPKPLPMRALPAPSPSDPPADYRNVKILNAGPDSAPVHRHMH